MTIQSGVRSLDELAHALELDPARLVRYGSDKAKVRHRPQAPLRGRLVLVSAITPTESGEGKTTISIGLAQGLASRGPVGLGDGGRETGAARGAGELDPFAPRAVGGAQPVRGEEGGLPAGGRWRALGGRFDGVA